ncbi:MAG: immunoglobulin domain-containing protein, partial [Verrucomicrobia bacterium]|nr:immunoglobulin domain-containing protein [Verrucomicrobiota bacterium]
NLQEVKCNNNGGSDGQTSVMEFPVEAGTRYYLVVDGVNGAKGLVHFTYELIQPPVVSEPTWFAIDPATGQVDSSVRNPVVGVGASVEYLIGIGGLPSSASVGYQWRRNGIDLPGATNATIRLNNISQSDAGDYTVEVSTYAGTVLSNPSQFKVAEPILLLVKPDNQTLAIGQGAYFAVVAFGAGPFQYQWTHDGQMLTGLTNSAFVLPDVRQGQAGLYAVEVTDGVSRTSASATLIIQEALSIGAQPEGQALVAGQNAQLSVTVQGVAPLSYQWQVNGVNIPGATAASLDLVNVQPAQAGDYTVIVSNPTGTIESGVAVVSVRVPLTILEQPVGGSVKEGEVVTLRVAAAGSEPLSYQWRFNDVAIAGATNVVFEIAAAKATDAGSYTVQVQNTEGSALSDPAVVSVEPAEDITAVLQIVTVRRLADLTAELLLTGPVGAKAIVEVSNDLSEWIVLANLTVPSLTFTHIDPDAKTLDARFYRVLHYVRLLKMTRGAGDAVELEVDGGEGLNVQIETTDDFGLWTVLGTARVQNGKVQFNDPNAVGKAVQFYRLQVVP